MWLDRTSWRTVVPGNRHSCRCTFYPPSCRQQVVFSDTMSTKYKEKQRPRRNELPTSNYYNLRLYVFVDVALGSVELVAVFFEVAELRLVVGCGPSSATRIRLLQWHSRRIGNKAERVINIEDCSTLIESRYSIFSSRGPEHVFSYLPLRPASNGDRAFIAVRTGTAAYKWDRRIYEARRLVRYTCLLTSRIIDTPAWRI